MPRTYYCDMCRDEGKIQRGFLYLFKAECPACKGDPIGTFRKKHPMPHMPPPPPGPRTGQVRRKR